MKLGFGLFCQCWLIRWTKKYYKKRSDYLVMQPNTSEIPPCLSKLAHFSANKALNREITVFWLRLVPIGRED